MKVGFIGLGNVGGKLAGSLLRNGHDLSVHDLDPALVAGFVARGAKDGENPAALMRENEVVVTCLPSPAACESVLTEMLPEIGPGKIWLEMSTTDAGPGAKSACSAPGVVGKSEDPVVPNRTTRPHVSL